MPPTRQTSRPATQKRPSPPGQIRRPLPPRASTWVSWSPPPRPAAGAALERLLAEARPKLLSLAMRVLDDADEAEDAVQDAMIKVWRNLGRFEGRAAFTTWLHRIAVNAALDRLRRRGSVPLSAGEPDEHHHDTASPRCPRRPSASSRAPRRPSSSAARWVSSPRRTARRCACAISKASRTRRSPR